MKVRFFASLREAVGLETLDIDLPEGASAEDAWGRLVERYPGLAPRRGSVAAAVNRRFAPFETRLGEGDELVFIPPVSGG